MIGRLQGFVSWLKYKLNPSTCLLTIVRKYRDANGSYVGELYLDGRMIGASLDSLPYTEAAYWLRENKYILDLQHDFLAYMPVNTIRVGAHEPKDNDSVLRRIAKLNSFGIRINTLNRFIEFVLER